MRPTADSRTGRYSLQSRRADHRMTARYAQHGQEGQSVPQHERLRESAPPAAVAARGAMALSPFVPDHGAHTDSEVQRSLALRPAEQLAQVADALAERHSDHAI